MTISQFVAHVERTCTARFVLVDGRLRVRGLSTLPEWTRQAVAAHRHAITSFLERGEDRDMTATRTRAELRRLGFMQLVETGRWVHPDGDHVGDQILLGLIPEADAEARIEHAREQAVALGAIPIPPRPQPVKDLREIYPGRYRWSENEGVHHKDPFPRLQRSFTE